MILCCLSNHKTNGEVLHEVKVVLQTSTTDYGNSCNYIHNAIGILSYRSSQDTDV